jgi:predicted RND superfamily exporter protein
MAASVDKRNLGLGAYIVEQRSRIGLILIAITAFMAYEAAHVKIATRFENFFPANHPDTLLYRKYQNYYGGA